MGIVYRIVQRGLLKKPHVEFACPTCKATLYAPLEDADKPDACPECGAGFVTPGGDSVRAQQTAERAEADRKAAEKERELEARAQAIAREAEARLERSLAAQRRAASAGQPTYRPGSWLGAVGWVLLILGLIGCIGGAAMDTTVPVSGAEGFSGTRFGSVTRVHNEGLMQNRLLCVVTSSIGLLFGLVLIGLDIAMEELDRIRRLLERPTEAPK